MLANLENSKNQENYIADLFANHVLLRFISLKIFGNITELGYLNTEHCMLGRMVTALVAALTSRLLRGICMLITTMKLVKSEVSYALNAILGLDIFRIQLSDLKWQLRI